MSSWSNEECLLFLQLYQNHPCIWDLRHESYKDKKQVANAWDQLSESMAKSVKELKNKKEILMGSFRKHLKKKLDSISSGADEIYKPIWFAYEYMESFLMPIYSWDNNNSEKQLQPDAEVDEMDYTDNDSLPIIPEVEMKTPPEPTATSVNFLPMPSDFTENPMAAAFQQLINALGQSQNEPEEDDCEIYAKLLAIKLRELPMNERSNMMYAIDALFINIMNQKRHTSPLYSRPPSAACSDKIEWHSSHSADSPNRNDQPNYSIAPLFYNESDPPTDQQVDSSGNLNLNNIIIISENG